MPHQIQGPDHAGRAIEVAVMTRATAERVWQCWTDPARVVEWFADRVTGSLEEGGFSWHFDRLGSAMTYRVIAMTPGEHLLLESAEAPGTRLEIVIAPQGDSTMVQIIHSGFTDVPGPDPDYVAVEAGWRIALSILRYYAEFHFGQSRECFYVVRPARFSLSRLATLYHDPLGLQEWLVDGGSLGTLGGRVHLALKSGEILRGDMLADTDVELAMAWDEIAGVLQFRTCSLPDDTGSRAVYLLGWGWGLSAERARIIQESMTEAVDRLEHRLELVPARPAVLSA